MRLSSRFLIVVLMFVYGCSRSEKDSSSRDTAGPSALAVAASEDSLPRRVLVQLPTPRWTRGGSASDSIFSVPTALAAGLGSVYVLDQGAHRVVALDSRSGRTRWMTAPNAEDAVFQSPRVLAVGPQSVLVAGRENTNILAIDRRNGRVTSRIPVPVASPVRGICWQPGGNLLLATLEPARPLVLIDPGGRILRRFDAPWGALTAGNLLQSQSLAASDSEGRWCVAALALGLGFSAYADGGFVTPHRYVEYFVPQRELTTQTVRGGETQTTTKLAGTGSAALTVSVDADRLFVFFEGRTPLRGRLIDVYVLATGEYERTYLMDKQVESAVVSAGTVFILYQQQGFGTLGAIPLP